MCDYYFVFFFSTHSILFVWISTIWMQLVSRVVYILTNKIVSRIFFRDFFLTLQMVVIALCKTANKPLLSTSFDYLIFFFHFFSCRTYLCKWFAIDVEVSTFFFLLLHSYLVNLICWCFSFCFFISLANVFIIPITINFSRQLEIRD